MILMLDEEFDEFESEKHKTLIDQIRNFLNEKTLNDPPKTQDLDFTPKKKIIK
jgi:hypothetical protein